MSKETQDNAGPEPASGAPEPSAAEPAPKTKRTRAKTNPAVVKTKTPSAKPRKTKTVVKIPDAEAAEISANLIELVTERIAEPVQGPIADLTTGEARISPVRDTEPESAALMEAYRADTTSDAEHGLPEVALGPLDTIDHLAAPSDVEPSAPSPQAEAAPNTPEHSPAAETEPPLQPAVKLERLQKILSQAGIASRRHAEEMIVEGRVMVNGRVVATLGAKADPTRDHIRVDGKLIHGPERHRTFVLNKPKGYVTTVDDPEGRPTVMQFLTKLHERLYPVGRLDYQSEGLLLMTNDGELANRLTRAASRVEKTYLVKIAGQPTEEELDRLRGGIPIERGASGPGKVVTASAQIRQVRQGDNPWYEVVLIEGRNRELRKMFQSIGHFVEKIRRVGYGPLVLDIEPGKFRELTAQELSALQLAAEGKLKPRHGRAAKSPEQTSRPAERYGTNPPARAVSPGPPRTAFGLRGAKPWSTQTGSGLRGGKPGPSRRVFGRPGGKPGPPQAGPPPRGGKPFRTNAPSRQETQQRFDNRGFRPRQGREDSSFQPQPSRPYRQHGEHSYLHRPAQPQSRPPQSRFDKPHREKYDNRSDRGVRSRPTKPWAAKPERDQRQSSGIRSDRPLASGPLNRLPPGRPSKPGNDGHRNRRGPARGTGNRFRKPGQ